MFPCMVQYGLYVSDIATNYNRQAALAGAYGAEILPTFPLLAEKARNGAA